MLWICYLNVHVVRLGVRVHVRAASRPPHHYAKLEHFRLFHQRQCMSVASDRTHIEQGAVSENMGKVQNRTSARAMFHLGMTAWSETVRISTHTSIEPFVSLPQPLWYNFLCSTGLHDQVEVSPPITL